MRPRGKKAGINTEASVDRVVGRLARVKIAIKNLEAEDVGMFEREKRDRIRNKIKMLKAERKELNAQLSGVKKAIDKALA